MLRMFTRAKGDWRFRNYIGGALREDNGRIFEIRCSFHESKSIIPESLEKDVRDALRVSKDALKVTRNMPLEERIKILERTADNLIFSEAELMYAVEMTGMPIKAIAEKAGFIYKMLLSMPSA